MLQLWGDGVRKNSRRSFATAFVLGVSLLGIACPAQSTENSPAQVAPGVFDFAEGRDPLVFLDGAWRFHLGDDPDGKKGWADPNFDDSAWPLIHNGEGWTAQGFHDTDGTAWYRAKVLIPAGMDPLSVYVVWINDSSEIFADGRLIGSFGGLPPHPYANYSQLRRAYPLPQQSSADGYTVSLAIRVWRWPHWAAYDDGGVGVIGVGESRLIEEHLATYTRSDAWGNVNHILLITLEGLATLAALALFSLRRGEREYLWFALAFFFTVAAECTSIFGDFHPIGMKEMDVVRTSLHACGHLAEIAFYFTLLRGKRNWLFWTAITSIAAEVILLVPLSLEYGNYTTWNLVHILLDFPIRIWILTILFQRTRTGLPDARLLFFPVVLQQTVEILDQAFIVGTTMGIPNVAPRWFEVVSEWPFTFSVDNATDALFLLAMIAIFIYRFNRASRQREQLSNELEAARIVQQVMIPEEIPHIPGYSIDSVYEPFGEVGGDFFHDLVNNERRCADRNWRCIREGNASRNDGVDAGGDAAHPGALYAEPKGNTGRDERTRGSALEWRIHYLPHSARRSRRHADHRQCRAHSALSEWVGTKGRIQFAAWPRRRVKLPRIEVSALAEFPTHSGH